MEISYTSSLSFQFFSLSLQSFYISIPKSISLCQKEISYMAELSLAQAVSLKRANRKSHTRQMKKVPMVLHVTDAEK
eukprot:8934412-Ditylum_brightwellii.AAC.1